MVLSLIALASVTSIGLEILGKWKEHPRTETYRETSVSGAPHEQPAPHALSNQNHLRDLSLITSIARCDGDTFVSVLAVFPAQSVGCFMCSSYNNSDPSCHDPFNPVETGIYHKDCKTTVPGRNGLFPAHFCVKMSGTSGEMSRRVRNSFSPLSKSNLYVAVVTREVSCNRMKSSAINNKHTLSFR